MDDAPVVARPKATADRPRDSHFRYPELLSSELQRRDLAHHRLHFLAIALHRIIRPQQRRQVLVLVRTAVRQCGRHLVDGRSQRRKRRMAVIPAENIVIVSGSASSALDNRQTGQKAPVQIVRIGFSYENLRNGGQGAS